MRTPGRCCARPALGGVGIEHIGGRLSDHYDPLTYVAGFEAAFGQLVYAFLLSRDQ